MHSQANVLLGCGTGRCGTMSLAKLLDGCEGVTCTHELKPVLPWEFDERLFQERLAYFQERRQRFIVGDVAYYYLPYLRRFIEALGEGVRIICLERPKHEVVRSFLAKTPKRNHWMRHDGSRWRLDPIWDPTFPKYEASNKEEALGMYWEDYRRGIRALQEEFPQHVLILPTNALNSREGQQWIFDFCGIPERARNYRVCHYNSLEETHIA